MKVTINFGGTDYVVTSRYCGTARPWDGKYEKQHHTITIMVCGKQYKTSFYCNDRTLKKHDVIESFSYIISDGISGNMDIDDFASEFGFDKVSELLRAYKGCQEAFNGLRSLGIGENEMYSLLDYLREEYDV